MTRVARPRGINVGGANALPMKKLRGLCETLGWRDVESYVASGNLVFDADGNPEAQASALREAIRVARGGRQSRAGADRGHAAPRPRRLPLHAGGSTAGPRLLPLRRARARPRARARARRAEGDGLETGRGVAWLHTPGGFGREKLAERLGAVVGCPLTARNLRTVDRLVEMLDARG
jgi:uncharacterized protein (DUF1697 family)